MHRENKISNQVSVDIHELDLNRARQTQPLNLKSKVSEFDHFGAIFDEFSEQVRFNCS